MQRILTKQVPKYTTFTRLFHSGSVLNKELVLDNQKFDLTAFKTVPKSNLYATIKIFNRPYLVTEGDELTIPMNLKNVDVGSVIKLNNIINLGSRDLVFYPPRDLSDAAVKELSNTVSVEATVIEKTKSKAGVRLITRQRNRKNRRTLVKPKKTVLAISKLDVNLD